MIAASFYRHGTNHWKNMQWFNEPEQWDIKGKHTVDGSHTPNRLHGVYHIMVFTVDDAPFLYTHTHCGGGEFEAKGKYPRLQDPFSTSRD